jgi:hypothetical protein
MPMQVFVFWQSAVVVPLHDSCLDLEYKLTVFVKGCARILNVYSKEWASCHF